MQPTPVGSFFRFLLGFMLFISISFGVTYGVNKFTIEQQQQQTAAAATAEMAKQYR